MKLALILLAAQVATVILHATVVTHFALSPKYLQENWPDRLNTAAMIINVGLGFGVLLSFYN